VVLPEIKFKTVRQFEGRFKKDLAKLEQRMQKARRRAAVESAKVVRRNVPVAFSELRDSVHVEGHNVPRVIVDAPHAAGVERGTRPHMPPIGPLTKWVRLRARQGLMSEKQLARLPGSSTNRQARRVAEDLRNMVSTDGSDTTDIDAPRQIAYRIALSIAKHGTKPHFYMLKSVPRAREILADEVKRALREHEAALKG
jgi:hypothetical protein